MIVAISPVYKERCGDHMVPLVQSGGNVISLGDTVINGALDGCSIAPAYY